MGIQSELLRIGTKIATEEPVIITDHLTSSVCLNWANYEAFDPGLKIEAVFSGRGQTLTLENLGSVLLEVLDRNVGESYLRVSAGDDETNVYQGSYAERFLAAFRQYENRPHSLVPVGIAGLSLGMAAVGARELIVV